MFLFRFALGFLLCFAINASGQKPITANKQAAKPTVSPKIYVKAIPRKGEDIDALLTRYGLNEYDCNRTEFLKINNLREGTTIKTTATYKLPVEVVVYNGKSIRSTLNISDWRVAKNIDNFNKFALAEGLRSDNFIQSKKLWVPWHELNCPEKKAIVTAEASLTGSKTKLPSTVGLGEKSISKTAPHYAIFGKKYQHTPLITINL